MSESASAFEQVTREKVEQVDSRLIEFLKTFEGHSRDVWEAIEALVKDGHERVPVWVVWVMTIQGTMIGAMATWIMQQLLK